MSNPCVIYITTLLVFVGRCKDVLANPGNYASYHVYSYLYLCYNGIREIASLSSVRQYRILPFGFVTPVGHSLRFAPAQCMGRPKPPFRQLADNATGRYPGT